MSQAITKIPDVFRMYKCVATDEESQRICGGQAKWIITLMKGDEEYKVCDKHAEALTPFIRDKDWIEYAQNERK